jgi:GNAT superfamily N-acetyltransferase
MLRVRPVTSIDDFAARPGDAGSFKGQVASWWDAGESRPEWCFLLEDDADIVGRVGFLVTPTTSDPAWLGNLPSHELGLYGLELPWTDRPVEAGRQLLARSLELVAADLPATLEIRANPGVHPHHDIRRALAESCGLDLFQEKLGFSWLGEGDRAATVVPDRLVFRTVTEIGSDAYAKVMAPCGFGTLDRNDRYYWEGCGPSNWAAQMMEYLTEPDAAMWLVGYVGDDPAGYVAVSAVEDWGSTITHVGVHPDHRGRGYIDDLLGAAAIATQQAGIHQGLSDVDVVNMPMITAMRRAGHRAGVRPWHVWTYRGAVVAVIDAALRT